MVKEEAITREPNGIRGVRRKKVQKNDLPVAEGGNRHADQR